jgi:N-acetylmuramoyl-L-alanine amidase
VLLETAYISNPQEERMLKKSSFHKIIAQAVASSVTAYFSGSTIVASTGMMNRSNDVNVSGKRKAEDNPKPMKTIAYRVKRGDNLNSIARQNETTLAVLLKLNAMKINDPLHAGKKILLPACDVEATGAKPLKKYVVKKGDTLFSLSKSCSLTIDELRRLNNMNDSDTLILGQQIKIPVTD